MVRYEMQRRASIWNGAGKASVGQASRQARHEPHDSTAGGSGGSSKVVSTAPRNSQEPKLRETRLVCLPCQPTPARPASGFSIKGAVSTNTLSSQPNSWAIQRPSAFSRFLITS